jgi:hypothetical protein
MTGIGPGESGMRNRIRRGLSYSNVAASAALFVALGGASYAAATLPRNSVGTSQLRNGAVTSAKVRRRSLRAIDFAPGQLSSGPRGQSGPAGPAGPAGPPGSPGKTNFVVRKASLQYFNCSGSCPVYGDGPHGNVVGAASCNAGERATGGGYNVVGTPTTVEESVPLSGGIDGSPNAWFVSGNSSQANGPFGTVYVVCASP